MNECGLACLGMILGYFDRHVQLTELRQKFPGDDPLTLDQLSIIAGVYRLQTRAMRCELPDLKEVQLPAILHVDFDHYVVLQKVHRNGFTIVDPAQGRLKLTRRALSDRFTGVLLEFNRSADFESAGHLPAYSAVDFLKQLPLAAMFQTLGMLLLLSLCVQAFALASPFFVQVVVDEVFVVGNLELASVIVSAFSALYVISAITQWLRGLLALHIGNQLSFLMSAGLLSRLVALPLGFFQRRTIGDIVSRFSSLKPLQDFVTTSATIILLDVLMATTTLFMLACYSQKSAAYIVVAVLLFILIQYALMIPFRRYSSDHIMADAKVQTHFIETVQMIDSIKRFEAETRRTTNWLNRLMLSINAQIRAGRYQLLQEIARYLLSGATLLGVVYLSIDDVVSATLTVGMLYAMVAYTNHFTGAVLSLASEWQRYLMLPMHVQRLGDIIDHKTDDRQMLIDYEPGRLRFDQVSFGYNTSGKYLIQNLNLQVEPGEKLSIYGPSGVGKSTLLKLMLGDLMPTSGEILVGGRLQSCGVRPHSAFSALLATDQLLTGTVTRNITFMDPHPDHVRMIRAARLACIHDEITRLPLAYQEKISEQGHKLSAGQRQRLLLARTLYRQAEILLLDEGTSHLDEGTETTVMQNILKDSRTCIFITHRHEIARLAQKTLKLGAVEKISVRDSGLQYG